jgi:hypothetical protein
MQNTWSAIAPSGRHVIAFGTLPFAPPSQIDARQARASEIRGEQVMPSGAAEDLMPPD